VVADPNLAGPVPGANPPWGAPSFDVSSVDYVVEEYYLGGLTCAYDLAPGTDYTEDGRWTAVAGSEAPYLTRILVVRPRDAAAFNGTVVLSWQNVSAGYELGALARGDEVFEGYAWVGVSAQEVGLYGFSGRRPWGDGRPLLAQDPERYGSSPRAGRNPRSDSRRTRTRCTRSPGSWTAISCPSGRAVPRG
jgi:hypothetical protein